MLSNSKIEFHDLDVASITPNGYNPNRMTPGHFEALKQTIRKDGFVGVALVNRTSEGHVLIDGEHRWLAAQELGIQSIPCAVIEVPDERARALTIKLNQIHGDWVPDLLAEVAIDLVDPVPELGFADEELDRLLSDLSDFEELSRTGAPFDEDIPARLDMKDGERYVGFNLNGPRRDLLDQALAQASPENRDSENPRAGALQVILRRYLSNGSHG